MSVKIDRRNPNVRHDYQVARGATRGSNNHDRKSLVVKGQRNLTTKAASHR